MDLVRVPAAAEAVGVSVRQFLRLAARHRLKRHGPGRRLGTSYARADLDRLRRSRWTGPSRRRRRAEVAAVRLALLKAVLQVAAAYRARQVDPVWSLHASEWLDHLQQLRVHYGVPEAEITRRLRGDLLVDQTVAAKGRKVLLVRGEARRINGERAVELDRLAVDLASRLTSAQVEFVAMYVVAAAVPATMVEREQVRDHFGLARVLAIVLTVWRDESQPLLSDKGRKLDPLAVARSFLSTRPDLGLQVDLTDTNKLHRGLWRRAVPVTPFGARILAHVVRFFDPEAKAAKVWPGPDLDLLLGEAKSALYDVQGRAIDALLGLWSEAWRGVQEARRQWRYPRLSQVAYGLGVTRPSAVAMLRRIAAREVDPREAVDAVSTV